MRILVVEDDPEISRFIVRGLTEEHHFVDLVEDGAAAIDMAAAEEYDAIVLDLMLPGIDGFEVCRRIRASGIDTPVIIVTARDAVTDRIAGLDGGADDYLVKPFAFAELVARLEALQRRAVGASVALAVGGVELDARRHHLRRGELEVSLSPRELSLAHELFTHAGDVMTRSHLLTAVWGWGFEGDPNILDVYVGYLRRKLDALGPEGPRIVAVRGVGFRLSPAEPER